jgi:hypothetical protein
MFIFIFILFYSLFFILYYPYFYFLFTLLDRVLQVRRSGQTAYTLPAEGLCLCHVYIYVLVCVSGCVQRSEGEESGARAIVCRFAK